MATSGTSRIAAISKNSYWSSRATGAAGRIGSLKRRSVSGFACSITSQPRRWMAKGSH